MVPEKLAVTSWNSKRVNFFCYQIKGRTPTISTRLVKIITWRCRHAQNITTDLHNSQDLCKVVKQSRIDSWSTAEIPAVLIKILLIWFVQSSLSKLTSTTSFVLKYWRDEVPHCLRPIHSFQMWGLYNLSHMSLKRQLLQILKSFHLEIVRLKDRNILMLTQSTGILHTDCLSEVAKRGNRHETQYD